MFDGYSNTKNSERLHQQIKNQFSDILFDGCMTTIYQNDFLSNEKIIGSYLKLLILKYIKLLMMQTP